MKEILSTDNFMIFLYHYGKLEIKKKYYVETVLMDKFNNNLIVVFFKYICNL